jgi:glutamine synthetase
MEFSGKELIKGESDASSFPSGGLRATFEARGYTAWDPTSYAFIKENTLCIPTAFCSYGGEALDKKTPLLRSMEAINVQALRILRLFGNDTSKRVITTIGAEQEYFLVDKTLYDRRPDFVYTGRTLFGALPPKAQELDDHYFGAIKPRVKEFMQDLDEELWKLGVLAKTEHNEAAPNQHELAPIYATTNIATDHNQLTMEMMKKVALKHNLACLLHEKPYDGVNGSGKHNNWSLCTDDGKNIFEPGSSPHENAQFLLFLTAVIKAVDEYPELLRVSVASAGNDHRLGGHEAPPAIVSIFLGDELTSILDSIADGTKYEQAEAEVLKIGAKVLPKIPKDSTDRNRTSPFAFTGNKFEFRMLGSSFSTSCTNIMINTIVAEELRQFADELEGCDNFKEKLNEIIAKTINEHRRILFSGNNYSDEWVQEAARRGLPNLKNTPAALDQFDTEKNRELFVRHKIYTPTELHSRAEILYEIYCKVMHIEASTMISMVKSSFIPAISAVQKELAETINAKRLAIKGIDCTVEETLLEKASKLAAVIFRRCSDLEKAVSGVDKTKDYSVQSHVYGDDIAVKMELLRKAVDEIEPILGDKYYPYPTYGELFFNI